MGCSYAILVKTCDCLAAGPLGCRLQSQGLGLRGFTKKPWTRTSLGQNLKKILLKELIGLGQEHEKYIERARELAMNFDRKKLAQNGRVVKQVLASAKPQN